MNKMGSFFAMLTLVFYFSQPSPSTAAAALAVGTTGDMIKSGIATGVSSNEPTKEAASALALKRCQSYSAAKLAAQQCKIITTYTRLCFASAFDPKLGTPGAGLALGQDKEGAEALALTLCQASAGKDRAKYCVVMTASGAMSATAASSEKGTLCDTHD
jgi:hypothetical protein